MATGPSGHKTTSAVGGDCKKKFGRRVAMCTQSQKSYQSHTLSHILDPGNALQIAHSLQCNAHSAAGAARVANQLTNSHARPQ